MKPVVAPPDNNSLPPPVKKTFFSFETCLSITIAVPSLLLIIFLFACTYLLITSLYDSIQTNYFLKKIIEPIMDRNANLTQAYNIRIKVLNDILLESKLSNIKYLLRFSNQYYDHSKIPTNNFKDDPNYYLKIDNKDNLDAKHQKSNENMFKLISHFFFIFQSNFDKGTPIQELILIDKGTKNYLTYCYNIEKEYIFFEKLSANDEVLELITSTAKEFGFADFIVNNPYQSDSYLNYVKFISFEQFYGDKATQGGPYAFIMGMRLKKNSLKKMFNIQKTNMTTVLHQYSFEDSIEAKLHYVTSSDFLDAFYSYALINMLDFTAVQSQIQFDDQIAYINTEFGTFFKLLSHESEAGGMLCYKSNWRKELTVMSKIFYSILKQYNVTDEIEAFKDLDCSLKRNKIICEAQKETVSFSFDISNYTSGLMSSYQNETDVWRDFYQFVSSVNALSQNLKYGNSKIMIESGIFENGQELTSTKFLIYNQTINNLFAVNIEITDIGLYSDSNDKFASLMNYFKSTMMWILFALYCFVFMIAFWIGRKELNRTMSRLTKISQLKNSFFTCKLNRRNNERDPIGAKSKEEDKNYKDASRWSEENIYKDEFFEQNNAVIVNTVYDRLVDKLEHASPSHDKRYTEKLEFLSQKYKLNEEKKGKEDSELASNIYKALSAVDFINFRDISYNIYYDNYSALNKEFNCLKPLLENVTNNENKPLKKSKYVTLEEVTQMIFHTKKNKIKRYINAMRASK